jgi:hypothetical protein
MNYKLRHMPLGDIAAVHPLIARAQTHATPHYLLPADVLSDDAIQALLAAHPVPVTRWGEKYVALGKSRALSLARAKLNGRSRIPVLDYSGADSTSIAAAVWAGTALHSLVHAHHPRDRSPTLDAWRAQIPSELAQRWSPSFESRRQFAKAVGMSRSTLSRKRSDEDAKNSPQDGDTRPLDRIRNRVHRAK